MGELGRGARSGTVMRGDCKEGKRKLYEAYLQGDKVPVGSGSMKVGYSAITCGPASW
jgi:hypothetical protein